MATVEQESRKLIQDAVVSLLTIETDDLTLRFTNATQDPLIAVGHGSESYTARQFQMGKFRVSSVGQIPRVDLKVDNVDRYWYAVLQDNNNLLGARVSHLTVYRQHLDDGANPSSTEVVTQVDGVIIARQKLTRSEVTFRVAAPLDQEHSKVGRVMTRHVCDRAYRVPTPTVGEFRDIDTTGSRVTCPYVGSAYFKKDGTATSNWFEDDCGLKLSDCKLRFGTASLPYKGFPSLGDPRA